MTHRRKRQAHFVPDQCRTLTATYCSHRRHHHRQSSKSSPSSSLAAVSTPHCTYCYRTACGRLCWRSDGGSLWSSLLSSLLSMWWCCAASRTGTSPSCCDTRTAWSSCVGSAGTRRRLCGRLKANGFNGGFWQEWGVWTSLTYRHTGRCRRSACSRCRSSANECTCTIRWCCRSVAYRGSRGYWFGTRWCLDVVGKIPYLLSLHIFLTSLTAVFPSPYDISVTIHKTLFNIFERIPNIIVPGDGPLTMSTECLGFEPFNMEFKRFIWYTHPHKRS